MTIRPAEEPSLSSYVIAVWKSRGLVALIAGATTLVGAAIVFILPPTFEASSSLMPTSPNDNGSILGRFGISLDDVGLQSSGALNSPISYPDILRSRRILGQVVQLPVQRNAASPPEPLIGILVPTGEEPRRTEAALKALRSDLTAVLDRRTGMLLVKYRSRYPMVASTVANALDSLLVEFTIHASAAQAGQNRRFIESRLAESQSDLAIAEEKLSAFRRRNVRFGSSAQLNMEESRLSRALRAEEEVYLTLRRQHELARIEERRDTPTLLILDGATVPVFKASPKRALSIGLASILGVLLGITWVVATKGHTARLQLVDDDGGGVASRAAK